MNTPFPNKFFGKCILTTEHAASSYGVPVLIDEAGNAYGPGDALARGDGLDWLLPAFGAPESATVGDAVRACIDEPLLSAESVKAARAFLGDIL